MANEEHTSREALASLLESIEPLLSRLRIYTHIPPSPSMDELVLKIIDELLCTLALATKELKQGRSCESPRSWVTLHSLERSQICQEAVKRET
jgi:hypothetical protein